ncbi:hypothetical protein Trydic_g6732 [Trypoxylus dichotomus]
MQEIRSPNDSRDNASRVYEEEKLIGEQLERVIKGLENTKAPGDIQKYGRESQKRRGLSQQRLQQLPRNYAAKHSSEDLRTIVRK